MELLLGNAFLTFDGDVVEGFGSASRTQGRLHIALVRQVELAGSRSGGKILFHNVWGGTPLVIPFAEEHRPAVVRFAEAVERARTDRRH